MPVLSRARLRAYALLLTLISAFGVLTATTAAPASAATTTYQKRVLHEASLHRGDPYKYGAAGPHRFDCSGFTMYVFGRLGKRLPHSSASQYSRVRHVSKSSMRAGDLIFFKNSSGRVYHVGIYAGGGYLWHAPHSGSTVRKAKIWTSSYAVGRV